MDGRKFLDGSKRGETTEVVGNTCFDYLLARSFFQRHHKNKYRFVIHDLAQFLSRNVCVGSEDGEQNKKLKQVQHFVYSSRSQLQHEI